MELIKDIFGSAEKISPFIFALRSIAVGGLLYIEGKVLPHRSGGQFAGYDFAFFWMMGGITAAPLFEAKNSFINTVVIVAVIYAIHYLISYIAVKNRAFAKIVMGKAIPLISEGKILRPNMAKALFPLELLKKGISDTKYVYAALIDSAGELYYSVITE